METMKWSFFFTITTLSLRWLQIPSESIVVMKAKRSFSPIEKAKKKKRVSFMIDSLSHLGSGH